MNEAVPGFPLLERRALLLNLCTFGFFGTAFGVWLVLLAELQATFSLSPATLGATLATGLVLSLPVMSLSGRVVDRWGAGIVISTSVTTIGIALVGTALAPTYLLLLPFFLLFYVATAAYEVGINAAAIDFEQTSGQQVIGYFHAAFSGFAAISALFVGVLLVFDFPFRLLYLLAAPSAVVLGVMVWRSMEPKGTSVTSAPIVVNEKLPSLYRTPIVLLLAAVAALAFMCEGEIGNWITIYLRSALDQSVLIGASGFVVFHSAMFVGRLLGARATRRIGRWTVLCSAGAMAAGGMMLALATMHAPIILLGFLLVGLGLSVVAPTAYSLAGDAAADQAGAASSILTTVGYSGYLVGPVLVGGIAEYAGLRLALATIIFAGGGITLLSNVGRMQTATAIRGYLNPSRQQA